jgi:DNA-binding beta-propeller fold protein YncE/mono/diheme cytochrome c family protein
MKRIFVNFLLALVVVCSLNYTARPERTSLRELILPSPGVGYLSPTAMVASPDSKRLYLACATANQVAVYNLEQREIVQRVDLPGFASGLALSPDGKWLYVTCPAARSKVCVVATATGKVRKLLLAGHTATAPVLSRDGRVLYICNQFNDSVGVIELEKGKEVAQIRVDREPVAAVLSLDGKLLFVANHLHTGRSDKGVVTATVSVIDTASRRLLKNIPLTNGSTLLRGLCISPDGRYVAVAHTLARFHLPATTVAHGWMNDNVLSLIDVANLKLLTTVLLDQDDRGAANPWAVEWSQDGKFICVTHAGTREVSIIDAPGLLGKLATLPPQLSAPATPTTLSTSAQALTEVPNDFSFLSNLRTRVKLHANGPRCLVLCGNKIFVGNYFSDSLSILDLGLEARSSATIQLETPLGLTPARKGEMYFNDGTLCYQGWQSCASCHSSDGRTDGMDWDLLNDGLGNPKNVKSLLFSFQTPPVMSMGVRSDAGAAIRAGIQRILFASPHEDVAAAIDEYVRNLQPVPSPYLVHNQLSLSAERGRKLFLSESVGCAVCHSPPLFTDLKPHAVGIGKFDQQSDTFYTPMLIEVWRTAPYLHDGSAATLRDVVLTHNPADKRGHTPTLNPNEVDDLVSYLLSL